jgi:hypothetical protein
VTLKRFHPFSCQAVFSQFHCDTRINAAMHTYGPGCFVLMTLEGYLLLQENPKNTSPSSNCSYCLVVTPSLLCHHLPESYSWVLPLDSMPTSNPKENQSRPDHLPPRYLYLLSSIFTAGQLHFELPLLR